jgi:hypothetical protein
VTDPRRLVEERDIGATLLASAGSDAPDARTRHRVAAALGLAASIATLTSASSGAGSMGATGTNLGAGAAGGRAGAAAWLTLVGGGLVATALAGNLIVATMLGHTRHSAEAVSTMPAAATVQAREAEPEPAARSDSSSSAGTPPTPMQSEAIAHRGKGLHAGVDPSGESPLARELRSLDAARSALERLEIGEAFIALDRYDRTFPNGTLRTEASLLRVDALLARGDGAEARRLARDLLARDPSGPQARRLRTIVEN